MAMTVTAAQSGTGAANGMALTVKVVTGALAASLQNGTVLSNNSSLTTCQSAITPAATGSWIYGAITNGANTTTFTANGSTTLSANVQDLTNAIVYGTCRSTSTTTASTPVTVGASAPTGATGSMVVSLAEIKAATTLAESGTAPATVSTTSAQNVTTASFTPPGNSLLVAMVSNEYSGTGTNTITVSGGGLTWIQLTHDSYAVSSVWIAQVPSTPTAAMSGSGTLTAGGVRGFLPAAALSGVGTLTASPSAFRTAALSGSGTLTAGGVRGFLPAAALSGQGTLTAGGVRGFLPAAALSGVGTLTALGSRAGGAAPAAFAASIPNAVATLAVAPGTPNGPGGSGGAPPTNPGSGWEIYVYSYANFANLLTIIPKSMLQSFQFAKQLGDLGSGTVNLSQDDPWWNTVILPDGAFAHEILDFECLWQVRQDGVPRFEFFGETITEQLVDASEQRVVSITGPGTISSLKRAICAPPGFPNIVLKLDAIQDNFDEVDANGHGVLDTNIWNNVGPAANVYITPVPGAYSYPGGAGYSLSTLYPSGSVTLLAVSGTTFLGATPYDATDTLISAQVSPIGLNNSTGAFSQVSLDGSQVTQFYIQSVLNPNYYALFGLSSTAFYVQVAGPPLPGKNEPSVNIQTKVLPLYDPSNHAYWMITEQGGSNGGPGTFYFWTSPDGQTWKQQWSVVHQWNATNCAFFFTARYDVDNKVTAQLSNLNTMVTAPSFQGAIYLNTPIMGVWYDQWAKAQARGTIPFTTTTISAGFDSFGHAWPDTQNAQTVNGTDLYSFLQSAASVLNADFIMQPGFVLQVSLPESGTHGIGVDRSQKIVFREGRTLMSRQRVRQRDLIQNVVGAQNQDGHEISAVNSTSVTAWGQREAWFQTAAQVDPVSMAIAAAAAAAANASQITSEVVTIVPGITGATVFQDFDCGDWVGLERPDFSATDSVRVVGIAIQVDQDGVETDELTLTTYVQWLEQQLTYISNKLGGAFVNAPGLTPVAPSKYGTGQVPTYFTPAATLANLADVVGPQAGGGNAQGSTPLVYNPATGQYQLAGSTDPVSGGMVPLSLSSGSGGVSLLPGTVTVTDQQPSVAPDGGGTNSPGNSIVTSPTTHVVVVSGIPRITTGMQTDGTVTVVETNGPPPAAPDAPSLIPIPAGLVVLWDGKLSSNPPLSDFFQVQVHVSLSSGFIPDSTTLQGTMITAGGFPVTGLTSGVTYYAKLVAVNNSGAASTPSAQVSAQAGYVTPSQISALTASLIGNIGVLNPNPYFFGGDATGWSGINGTFNVVTNQPAGSAYTYAAKLVNPGGSNAFLAEHGGTFPVTLTTPGTQYLVTAWVYSPTGSARIGFDWMLNGVVISTSTQTFTVPANTWAQVTTVQTAPTAGVNQGSPVCDVNSTSANTSYWEAILVLPQVPGTLVQAGTVTATQIAAGTVVAGIIDGTIVNAAIFNGSTFNGTNWIENTAGSFFYAATPAANNLTGTVVQSGGTDAQGNTTLAGITSYQDMTGLQPGGGFAAVSLWGNGITIYSATTEFGGSWTSQGVVNWSQVSGRTSNPAINVQAASGNDLLLRTLGGNITLWPSGAVELLTNTLYFSQASAPGASVSGARVYADVNGFLRVIDVDAQTYAVGHGLVQNTAGSTVNTGGAYGTVATANVGVGTYRFQGQISYSTSVGSPTGQPRVRFDSGTATQGHARGAFWNAGTPVVIDKGLTSSDTFAGNNLTSGAQLLEFDITIPFTVAGTFLVIMASTGSTYTVNYVNLFVSPQ